MKKLETCLWPLHRWELVRVSPEFLCNILVERVGPFFSPPHLWKSHVFLGSSASPGKRFLKPEDPHKKRTSTERKGWMLLISSLTPKSIWRSRWPWWGTFSEIGLYVVIGFAWGTAFQGPGRLEWEPCSPCGWGPSSCNSLAFSKLISVGLRDCYSEELLCKFTWVPRTLGVL